MNDEQLKWAGKWFAASIIKMGDPELSEDEVWDTVDRLHAERVRRDAKPAKEILPGPIAYQRNNPHDPAKHAETLRKLAESERRVANGASSTACDETQAAPAATPDGITDAEIIQITEAQEEAAKLGRSVYVAVLFGINDALDIIAKRRRDTTPRFTADEVAARLVRVEPDAVGVSALVYVGGVAVRVEDDRAEAERVASSFRKSIRRTLGGGE